MLKLGFDLDGVLYPWQKAAYEWCIQNHISDKPVEEFWRDFHTLPVLMQENIVRIQPLYENFIMRPEVIKMLNRLSERYDITYITQRPLELSRVTVRYLRKYKLPNWETTTVSENKIAEIRRQHIDIYVEDRTNFIQALRNFCQLFWITQPYNWNDAVDGVTRIYDVTELENYL